MPPLKLSDFSEPVECYRLSNGLPVVVHSFPSPAVGFSFLIRCGPIFELPQKNGISHFLEHMLFRGIPEYPSSDQLGVALDKVGCESNAATFSDMTVISQKVLPEAVEKAMIILKSMVNEPVFEGIAAEKRIIMEECLEDIDEEGQVIAIDQLSAQLIFGNHPYSYSILGTPEKIRKLSRNDLFAHLKKHYRPNSSVLCLSGAVSPKKAILLAEKIFGSWKNGLSETPLPIAEAPPFRGPRLHYVDSARSQIVCRISFRAIPFSDPNYYVLEAISRILDCGSGSPIRKILQDKLGFCYNLGVGVDAYEKCGALHIDMNVKPERLVKAIRASLEVLKNLALTGFSEEVLEHMKEQYLKAKRFSANDLWEFSGRAGFNQIYPSSKPLETEFLSTQNLSTKLLDELAKKIFNKRNLGLTLVGPISQEIIQKAKKEMENFI